MLEAEVRRRRDVRASADALTFNQTILALLEHVEYRPIAAGDDLDAIYKLRYNSYVHAGILKPNALGLITDRYDELPNSYRFGVYYDGELISTLRLHYLSREFPDAPATDLYGDLLQSRLQRGETFIEGTRFAADTERAPLPSVVPFLTLRLGMVASCYFGQTAVLTAIKPDHAAFYRRIFNAAQISGPVSYPGLTVPGVLFETACGNNLRDTLRRFPFFQSNLVEQRMLFAPRHRSEPHPLTVLPTAKYVREAA